MQRSWTVFSLFLVFLYALGCSRTPPPAPQATPTASPAKNTPAPLTLDSKPASSDDSLVAEWTGGKLYLSQLDKMLEPRRRSLKAVTTDDTLLNKMLAGERRQVLDTLVDNYLLLLEAHARNLSLTNTEQEQVAREAHGQFNNEEEYQKYLQQSGRSEEDLVRVLVNIRLAQKCMEDQRKRILESITPENQKKFYEENIKMFTPPARSSINRVEIWAGDKRAWEEAETLARRLYEEVKKKVEPLKDLQEKRKVLQEYANNYSDTAEAKFNYGYVIIHHDEQAAKQYAKEFLDEVLKRKEGELSSLVKDKSGYGFFLMLEQVASYTHSFDSEVVKSMLPNMIPKMKMDAWHEELKKKYNLRIHEEYLPYKNGGKTPSAETPFSTPTLPAK